MTAIDNLFKILLVELSSNPDTVALNEQLRRWQKAFQVNQSNLPKIEQQLIGKLMHQVKLKKIPAKKAHFMLTQYLVCSGLENSKSIFAMTHACALLAKQKHVTPSPVIQEFVNAKEKIESHSISGYQCVDVIHSAKYQRSLNSLRRVS